MVIEFILLCRSFPPVFSLGQQKYLRLWAAGLLCLTLPACATQQEETIAVQRPTFEQTVFDLTNGTPVDPLEMASRASNPSVQVFPFDRPGVTASGIKLTPPKNGATSDPSVQVMPFEAEDYSSHSRVSVDSAYADTLLGQPSYRDANKPKSDNFVSIAAPGEPVVRIYFAHDSSQLDPSSMSDISAVSARFNPNRSDYILSVEGHASLQSSETDPVKRRIVNMRVATDRAYNVARALMEAGIAPEKIRTVSWGESMPSGPHGGMDANAASRRVEIFRIR